MAISSLTNAVKQGATWLPSGACLNWALSCPKEKNFVTIPDLKKKRKCIFSTQAIYLQREITLFHDIFWQILLSFQTQTFIYFYPQSVLRKCFKFQSKGPIAWETAPSPQHALQNRSTSSALRWWPGAMVKIVALMFQLWKSCLK